MLPQATGAAFDFGLCVGVSKAVRVGKPERPAGEPSKGSAWAYKECSESVMFRSTEAANMMKQFATCNNRDKPA